MALSAAGVRHLRPPKYGPSKERGRTRGVVRQGMAFKADAGLKEYVEAEAKVEGWSVTTVLNDMLTTQADLERALGDKWWVIEGDAVAQRKPKGKVLAELVLAGLGRKK